MELIPAIAEFNLGGRAVLHPEQVVGLESLAERGRLDWSQAVVRVVQLRAG